MSVGQVFQNEFCFRLGTQFWFNRIYTRVTGSHSSGDDIGDNAIAWDFFYKSWIGNFVAPSVHYVAWRTEEVSNPSNMLLSQFDIHNPFGTQCWPIDNSVVFSYRAIENTSRHTIQFWAGFDVSHFADIVNRKPPLTYLQTNDWIRRPVATLFTLTSELVLYERPRVALPSGRVSSVHGGLVKGWSTNCLRTRHDNVAVAARFGY